MRYLLSPSQKTLQTGILLDCKNQWKAKGGSKTCPEYVPVSLPKGTEIQKVLLPFLFVQYFSQTFLPGEKMQLTMQPTKQYSKSFIFSHVPRVLCIWHTPYTGFFPPEFIMFYVNVKTNDLSRFIN